MSEVHEMKTLTLAGEEFNSFQDQQAREELLKKLPKPDGAAKVGQYLRVKSVDEAGNITGLEPVDANQDSGGNVAYDKAQTLTDEQKAQARANIGAQPAGDYLTEVPEGYAKTDEIPTDEHINGLINAALGVIENGTY